MNLSNVNFCDSLLSVEQIKSLKPGDSIDHRDRYGLFRPATIITKSETEIKIHYDNRSDKWDICIDFTASEFKRHRFASIRSISQRPSNRFKQLSVGDYVQINPPFKQIECSWKICKITKMDTLESGQFQVQYKHQNKSYLYWFHMDNVEEVKWFDTQTDNINQLTNFGYSMDEIVNALNETVNKTNINAIIAIIQKHNEQEIAIQNGNYVDEKKSDDEKNKQMSSGVPDLKSGMKLQDFKIYIAIDFGTDGVGLAYFLPPNRVFIHTEWLSTKVSVDVKIKTIILLDEKYNVLSFGGDAKFHYMGMPKMKDKWLLFERFKMALYDDEDDNNDNPDFKDSDDEKHSKVSITDELTATNGTKVKSSVVFIAAFKYLQKLALDYLYRKKIENIKDSDIQWIITVPAIWNDNAKYKMRQWTIDAGLVDKNIINQCKIVYEPDCASLAMQKQIYETLESNNTNEIESSNEQSDDDEDDSNLFHFGNGDKYILVDAGGGTVDIACHQVMGDINNFGVKEIHHPSGGKWGSSYIDDQFVKLLHDTFSAKWVDEFKTKHPQEYLKLIHNFQSSKIQFYNDTQSDVQVHNVRVDDDFVAFMQDKIDDDSDFKEDLDVEDFVSEKNVFGQSNMIQLDEEYLSINISVWEIMFNSVIDPTVRHIHKLLNKQKLKNSCKYLCLVGGLSTSKYFKYRMEQEFGPTSKYKLTIIVPIKPILSVVTGAAYFGTTRNYIKARVLRYTYGQVLSYSVNKAISKGVPLEYINQNKFYDEINQKPKVNGCFQVIARKNEEIETGDVRTSHSKKDRTVEKISSKQILCSNLEFPKVKSDGKVIGKIVTKFDENDELHIKMILEFHFYDTIIKVISYRENAPNIKQHHYITNYS